MNNINLLKVFSILIIMTSCAPSVTTMICRTYDPVPHVEDVMIIGLAERMPENIEVLGQIKIGYSGFSNNCSFDVVLDRARKEVRKVGGNCIKITEHILPDVMSSCHRIKAFILKADNLSDLKWYDGQDEVLDVDYAIINVFRLPEITGSVVCYDLYLGDEVICRVRNNFKTTIHVTKFGMNTLWAKTESKCEIPIDIERGRTYLSSVV